VHFEGKFIVRERKTRLVTAEKIWIRIVALQSFAVIVLPSYALALFMFKFKKSDIGGASYDAINFHTPLIFYIADNWRLPEPSGYTPFSLPLWHFIMAGVYKVGGSRLIDILQFIIAILTLYLLFSILSRFVSTTKSAIGSATLGFNSYFVAASVYPTTDGLAFFSFLLFLFTVNKMVLRTATIADLVVMNVSVSLSALNRQMFVFLFLIYLCVFCRRRGLRQVIIDLLPSGFLVSISLYIFYVDYCGILNNSECDTVGTFKSLPVIVNLSVAALLFAIFTLPILLVRKTFVPSAIPLMVLSGLASTFFFLFYASQAILKSTVQTGGGFFKLREWLGASSEVFDILAVSIFLVIVTLLYRRMPNERWMIHSVLVVWISTLLGPVAFQRYFEPYLLVLGLMVTFSMQKALFADRKILFFIIVILLNLFQFTELLLSIFIGD
jgi:hypothetical protein